MGAKLTAGLNSMQFEFRNPFELLLGCGFLLGRQPLVQRLFGLSLSRLSQAKINDAQPEVRGRLLGVELDGPLKFRRSLWKLALTLHQDAEFKMRLPKLAIESHRFAQHGFGLIEFTGQGQRLTIDKATHLIVRIGSGESSES